MNELQIIIQNLRGLRLNGNPFPRKIEEIEVLMPFGNFESLLMKIKERKFNPYIDNNNLYDAFEFISTKRAIRVNKLLVYAPFVVGILVSIFGIIYSNYWLLLAIPTIFISQFLSGFGKIFSWISLIGAVYSLIITSNLTLGLIFITSFLTFIFSARIREHRRIHMLEQALSNEEIFCCLFHAKIIRLWDQEERKPLP